MILHLCNAPEHLDRLWFRCGYSLETGAVAAAPADLIRSRDSLSFPGRIKGL
jgi:hypothetical protein